MLKTMLLSAVLLTLIFLVLHVIQMKYLPNLAMTHRAILITIFVSSLIKTYLLNVLHNMGYIEW